MSDERFFSQVKSSLYDFAPVVPDEAYKGMRRKLWISNFTRLSATRFNMWYLLLALAGGSAAVAYYTNSGDHSNQIVVTNDQVSITEPAVSANAASNVVLPVNCASSKANSACCSAENTSKEASSCSMKHSTPDKSLSASLDKEKASTLADVEMTPIETQEVNTNASEVTELPEKSQVEELTSPTEDAKKSRGQKGWNLRLPRDKDEKKNQ